MARICPDPSCAEKYPDDVAFCGECGKITIQEQLTDNPDLRLGQQLGDYVLVAKVADGAMGRVYEGRHVETRVRVAVKVLHPEVARDKVAVERFKREYETAAEMDHPNIVKVIDFGTTPDGMSFMTMEYLEGEELGLIVRRNKGLAPERMIRALCQIALGLDYAHSFGFIHRDLKPDNIFLCRGEEGDNVRILDFGSVKLQMDTGPKLTAFGTTLGSPYYMSPEQAMGKQDVDQRTDVFALAAIVYEAVTGSIAFEGSNIAQILVKIINENPPPPSQLAAGAPPRLDDVIEKGLRKDKTRRYPHATALAAAVCEAFGLDADAGKWGSASVEAIRAALSSSVPPGAKPFSMPSDPPQPAPVRGGSSAAGVAERLSVPGLPRPGSMKLGAVALALAVVVVLFVLLLR